MTIDNLIKRNIFKPIQCQFCTEHESIPHLFFECIIARNIWDYVESFTAVKVQSSPLRIWLANGLVGANLIYLTASLLKFAGGFG